MTAAEKRALRERFEHYFAHLKADAKREGYRVNKADEWERFVEKAREDAADEAA